MEDKKHILVDSKIVRKSNNFVEAQYHLSLWEMRVLIRMLSFIEKEDTDFEEYDISVQDFKSYFDIDNDGSVYTRLRDAVRSLMKKIITIRRKLPDGRVEETEMPMIVSLSKIVDDKSKLRISFHPKMRPYLLELKDKYLMYKIDNVLRLPTSYSIRLYELTKQYAKIGKRSLSIDEFKKILGIEDKYKQYTHLKKRIIEPSIEHINEHTDIILAYKEEKKGKKVVKLLFVIQDKTKTSPSPSLNELEQTLLAYKVSNSIIKKWRTSHTDEHIKARIAYMEAQDAVIQNPAAYLSSIMDKEITAASPKMEQAEKVRIAKGILFSRPQLEQQLLAKYPNISEQKLVAIIEKKFPEKFTSKAEKN